MTQPRDNLFAVQTPQVFRFGPLYDAHLRAREQGFEATDDSALLEWMGMSVHLIAGEASNLKVTYPADLVLAAELIRAEESTAPVSIQGAEGTDSSGEESCS